MIEIKTDRKTQQAILKMGRIPEDFRDGIAAGFDQLGSQLVRTGENQALEVKRGRKYRLSSKLKRLARTSSDTYTASAPGESPALLTGNYFENFKWERHGWAELEFGNDADYSDHLEFGTSRIKPRPGVQNSVQANLQNARIFLEQNIGENLKL